MNPIPTTLALLPFDLRRMSERVRRYHERHLMKRMGELDELAGRTAPMRVQPKTAVEALWMILDERLPPDTGASVCAFLDELVTQGRLGDAAMYARWYDRLQERFASAARPEPPATAP